MNEILKDFKDKHPIKFRWYSFNAKVKLHFEIIVYKLIGYDMVERCFKKDDDNY